MPTVSSSRSASTVNVPPVDTSAFAPKSVTPSFAIRVMFPVLLVTAAVVVMVLFAESSTVPAPSALTFWDVVRFPALTTTRMSPSLAVLMPSTPPTDLISSPSNSVTKTPPEVRVRADRIDTFVSIALASIPTPVLLLSKAAPFAPAISIFTKSPFVSVMFPVKMSWSVRFVPSVSLSSVVFPPRIVRSNNSLEAEKSRSSISTAPVPFTTPMVTVPAEWS